MLTRAPIQFARPKHRFDRLPMDIVGQIGDSGAGGIAYYFNHFYRWEGPTAAVASPGTAGWIVTATEAGTSAASLRVIDSAQFGILRITNDNASADRTQLQLTGSGFRYVDGKRLWCFARLALDDVDLTAFGFGLIIETDTDMINTFPTDGLFFEKAATATTLDFHARKGGTSTERTALTGTLADNTMVEIGFVVDVSGNVQPYVGGVAVGSAIPSGNANLPNTEDLTLAVQIQNGSAAARNVSLDWLLVAQER